MQVVLSHPFSGALYAFFAEYNEAMPMPAESRMDHPYYRTLYGDTFNQHREMALTMVLMFEKIILVPADAYLPRGHWGEDGRYDNPHLGLFTEWDFELNRRIDDDVERFLADSVVREVLARVPPISRRQILRDCVVEVHLAQKFSCPIVCAGGRRKLLNVIWQPMDRAKSVIGAAPVVATEEYLKIAGPVFAPGDLDTLMALKEDPHLRGYARAFTAAMMRLEGSIDPRASLLRALREAMSAARIANNLSGVFDGTATALNFVGLVPVLGTVASIVGIGADVASKGLGYRGRSQSWFELAARIRHTSSVKQLERALTEELALIERAAEV